MKRVVDIVDHRGPARDDGVRAVTLDFDHRYRRRIVLTADDGGELLLDLPEARALHDGDRLLLDDGSAVVVRAADEDVCDVDCPTARELARVAWHLGNRHLPVEVLPNGLRIRDDEVIVGMLEGMGARTTRKRAPFHPEAGAYASRGHVHGHEHGHHGHHD